MSKASSLAKNTIILAIGKLSSQMIGFLLLPLYTFYLSPAEYGLVDLTVVYITLLVPALTLQMEMAAFRYLIDARNSESQRKRIISNILYVASTLVLPWLILLAVIGNLLNFEYTWIVLLTGVATLCSNIAQQITRGLGNNKQFAIASALIGLATLIGAVLFIVIGKMGVNGMLLSIALANITGASYLVVSMRIYKYVRFDQKDKQLQREILGYSTPLVPNGIAWWVINASDRTIISAMINTSANGIYAVSTKYAAILNSLYGIFNMSWSESASVHINAPDRDKFFSQVANVAVKMFGTLGLGLIGTIPFIFPFMVDEKFNEAYLYIPIMVIGVFFNVIVSIYSAIYIAKKQTKQVMSTSIASAIINIILTVALIPLFGLYAAAFATAIAFLAMAIFRHYDAKKYVKITYQKSTFVVLGALYAVVLALYYTHTPWASIAALIIAIIAAYLLNRSEIERMKSMALKRLGK